MSIFPIFKKVYFYSFDLKFPRKNESYFDVVFNFIWTLQIITYPKSSFIREFPITPPPCHLLDLCIKILIWPIPVVQQVLILCSISYLLFRSFNFILLFVFYLFCRLFFFVLWNGNCLIGAFFFFKWNRNSFAVKNVYFWCGQFE